MIEAARYDGFKIVQGSTFDPTWTYKDPAGVPVNLTGYTARLQIAPKYGAALALDLTTGNGGITLGGAAGTIAINMTDEQSATVPVPDSPGEKAYIYELTLTPAGGAAFVLLYGRITFIRGL